MAEGTELGELIQPVLNSNDPVNTLRHFVLGTDGIWMDAGSTELFEISYAGVVGIGFGVQEAAQHWLKQAQAKLSVVDVELLT